MAASPVGFESLTIAATAVSLTKPGSTLSFIGVLETADVRMRSDATAPTSTIGQLIRAWRTVALDGDEVENASFIRTGSTSATLQGHFYNQPSWVILGIRSA